MKIPRVLRLSKKKSIILGFVIIAAILTINFFNKPGAQTLQFTQVKKQGIRSTVSSSGTLTGKNMADLKFKSSGKLSYINVKVGDTISRYQVVAGLDTQDLNITLQQAYNTLRDKEAAKQKTEDDVKGHDSDESFAQKVTRTAAEVAKDNAFDNVKTAQRAFQDAVIISPISGIITKAPYIPGQIIGSDAVAQVVDFSQFYFDTDIDEADIGKISLEQKAEVILDAYAEKVLQGEVSEIIPQTKTTSSGATVVTVRIKLSNPEITPINGLSGQASVILFQAQDVLTIPQEALRDDNTVFIQTEQGTRPKKIKAGIKSDTDIEIKEGLSEGNRVLLNPPANGNFGNFQRSNNPLNFITRFLRIGGGPTGGGGQRFNR